MIETADKDLMKAILSPPPFQFLEELRSSPRLRTFEEIFSSTLDEDLDYRWVLDQGIQSTLHPEALGLVLSGQPVGDLVDLSKSFEEAGREAAQGLDVLDDPVEDTDSPGAMEVDAAGRSEDGTVAAEEPEAIREPASDNPDP